MTQVKWGILGPGDIAHNFAQGLAECDSGMLHAIASTSAERRAAFGEQFGIAADKRFDSYATLLADPTVDAVYIATPHPYHAPLAIQSLRAGKHVVVEKPAGLIAGEVVAITEVATQQKRFFMEAMMYRCHPQIAQVLALIAQGTIGDVRHITAKFGFSAGFDPASRLFDPMLGGGGILDVGIYPMSFARLIAGAALGQRVAEPIQVAGTATFALSGVDATAFANLLFPNGITADIACAVAMNMDNSATIIGSKGSLRLPDPWVPGRNAGPSDAVIHMTIDGNTTTETLRDARILFAHEAELTSRAILDGLTEAPAPAPNHADSIGNARALDSWRQQAGYVLPMETPAHLRHLHGVMPKLLPPIPVMQIAGSDRAMSQLILGCDNRDTLAEGAIVWDAWWEAGGNAFDTGFVYGGGRHETLLGEWMTARGVSKAANVIVKGGHSPYCFPDAIAAQLAISLERLQLDHAPFYILHRDNPDVPVGEFVDALNHLHDKGLIGAFGGSNWAPERIKAAHDYAVAHNCKPLTILNNNLSLAVMERPIWPGCISSNDPGTLAFLRSTHTAHMSWSSQARGYFRDVGARFELPADTSPDVCFASTANAERRQRAATLGAAKGVNAHNIATAWVLAQSFPSFAIIGPRSPGEIVSTLPALNVSLTPAEVSWLNLETD